MELIDSIGIEKPTHYGKSFKVVSKAEPSNAAYTTLPLGLHLDMPIYRYKPGVRHLKNNLKTKDIMEYFGAT